jgi:hypothetical protein
MAKTKLKKVITIETFQRTVIHRGLNQPSKIWCEFCQAEVEMTAPELAAKISGIKVREIYRCIENREFHFFETETGDVFICINQLMTKQRGDK